ncbi:MAG: AMIN domain-containing protein [Desulfovibrionaceae bacterium]|nr:AMIN domain-containing protein [Desulfovibrionaceae bacterium]
MSRVKNLAIMLCVMGSLAVFAAYELHMDDNEGREIKINPSSGGVLMKSPEVSEDKMASSESIPQVSGTLMPPPVESSELTPPQVLQLPDDMFKAEEKSSGSLSDGNSASLNSAATGSSSDPDLLETSDKNQSESGQSSDALAGAEERAVVQDAETATSDRPAGPIVRKQASGPKNIVVTTKSPRKVSGTQKIVKATRLSLGKNIVFLVTGEETMHCKTMFLKNPYRYVVDIRGNWIIDVPDVPKNRLLKTIRVGRQSNGYTRVVLECLGKPMKTAVRGKDTTTLEIRVEY